MAKLLKKLIAGVSAAAVLMASAAIPAMAEIGDELVLWDYTSASAEADWTTQNEQVTQAVTDGMLCLTNTNSGSNRTASKALSTPLSDRDIVLDYYVQSYSNGDNDSSLYVGVSDSNYLFKLNFPKYGQSLVVNDGETITINNDGSRNTPLLHIRNSIMMSSDLVQTVIEYADGSGVIYSGTSGYASNPATESVNALMVTIGKANAFYVQSFAAYEYIVSNQDTLDAAMTNFNLVETQFGMEKADNYYIINRDITLPSAPSGMSVSWDISQKEISDTGDNWEETSFASINGSTLIVTPTEDSANYYVKAEATVTYRDAIATKSFLFVVEPIDTTQDIVYYDLNFDEFSGTLADLSQTLSNNTTYEDSHGLTFTSEYRPSGNSGITLSAVAKTTNSSDKCIDFTMTSNVNDARKPKIHLSRSTGISINNTLMVEMDVNFPTTSAQLLVSDSGGSSIALSVPSEDLCSTWLTCQIAVTSDATYVLTFNGDSVVSIATSDTSLSDVAQITVPTENVSSMRFDNLYIADIVDFAIEDQQVVEGVYSNLNIDTTQSGITASGSAYRVTDDFRLPSYSLMNSSVEWSVYQRAKSDGSELEETTFASIDGTTLTIAPTDDTKNYDVILRATIRCGEAEQTKDFILNILTPIEVATAAAEPIDISYADGSKITVTDGVYEITKDILLVTSAADNATVSWSASDSRITSTGGVYPNDSDEDITITATVSFKGASTKKTFTASLPNAITDYIDPATENLKASNADDTTVTYSIDQIGTVANDIKLPTERTTIHWEEFDGSVRRDWTTESANITIKDGVAEYTVSDFDEHEVTITGTATYVKNGQDVISKEIGSYTYKVQFPESAVDSEDTVYDKYKVRFDAAYDANFSSIPTSTTSNITLPQTGHFGSAITWNSDAPAIISNTGNVSPANTTRTVNLTATILKGASSATKTIAVTVAGKGNNGGGGGGGTTSSTGTSSGGGGGGAIASSNGSNVSLTKPTTGQEKVEELIEQREEAENRFSDLGGVSWARDAINGLYDAGIVNGKTDTLFAPNDNVTRAEFAKMLMGVFGLTSDAFTTSSFYDVPSDSWYFQSVESAYNLGIINGVAAGYFDPNANITRQDMAVMVMRAATVSGRTISATTEAKSFNDADSIADYAKEAVTTLQTGGIINGVSDTEFAPLSNATRAQAAQILYSFL